MRRLAKNLILTTVVVSAIFFVDYSSAGATALHHEEICVTKKICPIELDKPELNYLDFWSKFRDTVMPDKPQDNNPPKEMRKHKPRVIPPPKANNPKPAQPPKEVNPKPAN